MRWREWLIHRLGGVVPEPYGSRSTESNAWLQIHAPSFVVSDVWHLAGTAARQHAYIQLLQTENQNLRRQTMHVSYVSPDFPHPAA